MPLSDVARRYADNLFAQKLEETSKWFASKVSEIRLEFQRRGLLVSGPHLASLERVSVEQVERLAEARIESLLAAYEKGGATFDEAALEEMTNEIVTFCNTQRQHAVNFLMQQVQQLFGASAPSGTQASLVATMERGVDGVVAALRRKLQIRRDEDILLTERERSLQREAYGAAVGKEWDAFICHASEDKDGFVRPLAQALGKSGLRIWYDEWTLKVGDRLRAKIDEGLAKSRFGVVVLSHNFFAKKWPQDELDGLVAKEVAGVKVILPVWHRIEEEEVRRYSPLLAGRLAAKSLAGVDEVARQLRDAMGL